MSYISLVEMVSELSFRLLVDFVREEDSSINLQYQKYFCYPIYQYSY